MTAVDLDRLSPAPVVPVVRLRERFCARFSRACALLRLAHDGRVPF